MTLRPEDAPQHAQHQLAGYRAARQCYDHGMMRRGRALEAMGDAHGHLRDAANALSRGDAGAHDHAQRLAQAAHDAAHRHSPDDLRRYGALLRAHLTPPVAKAAPPERDFTVGGMTKEGSLLQVFQRSAVFAKAPPAEPAQPLTPHPSAGLRVHAPAPPNTGMDGHLKPPGAPRMTKLPGESGEQAISRHVGEHAAHLDHLESQYGLRTPRGHATVMMGLPGSGKSHYLKGHHMSHGTHLHVDVDALKHLAPGEHDYTYPTHYPEGHAKAGQAHPRAGQLISHYDESNPVHVAAAHPVSKRLEEHLFKSASDRKLPLALDTTGGNHKRWGQRMQTLREKGYHQVNLANVRVSRETSMARNAGRKRTVPQSVIDGTLAEHDRHSPGNHGKTPFEHLSAHADKVHVVDHESPEGQRARAASGWHQYLSAEKGVRKALQAYHSEGMEFAHRVVADHHADLAQEHRGSSVGHAHGCLACAYHHLAAAHQAHSRARRAHEGGDPHMGRVHEDDAQHHLGKALSAVRTKDADTQAVVDRYAHRVTAHHDALAPHVGKAAARVESETK